MPKNNIVYPFFEECSEFILDPWWKVVFSGCASAKFPRGTRYSHENHTMSFRCIFTKAKPETISLPQSPMEAVDVVLGIFRDKMGIFSPYDQRVTSEKTTESAKSKIHVSHEWKNIKPKTLKDVFVSDFVLEVSENLALTERERKQFNAVIVTGISFKKILPEDIVYRDRKIHEIINVDFDPKTRVFSIKSRKEKKSGKPSVSGQKTNSGDVKNTKGKIIYQAVDLYMRTLLMRSI